MAKKKAVKSAALVWVRIGMNADLDSLCKAAKKVAGKSFAVLSDIRSDDEALRAFAAGARAYCNSHAQAAVLRQIAEVVGQGGLWIGESLMQRLLTATARVQFVEPEEAPPGLGNFADCSRTRSGYGGGKGASNKEIARQLDITERTVKAHVGAILDKLKVRDRLRLSLCINGWSR